MVTAPSCNGVSYCLDIRKAPGQGVGAQDPGQARQKAGPISQRPTGNGTILGELRENSAGLGVFAATKEPGPRTRVQRCKRDPGIRGQRAGHLRNGQEETVEAGERTSRLELGRKHHYAGQPPDVLAWEAAASPF